jgi:hypothetical protein
MPATVPQRSSRGKAYQFEWSQEDVEIAGKPMRVKVAHACTALSNSLTQDSAHEWLNIEECGTAVSFRKVRQEEACMGKETATEATHFDTPLATDMMLATQRLWETPLTFYTFW